MIELKLSKEIYPLIAINYAITQFSELCDTAVASSENEYLLAFSPKISVESQILISEFENFLIDYINSEKLYDTN